MVTVTNNEDQLSSTFRHGDGELYECTDISHDI